MLDLARLQKIQLSTRPLGQRVVATAFLGVDYNFPRRTEIVIEGLERLPPERGLFIAMNHTDRYNYWPLQYRMWRLGLPFTATWVKGKYYENPLMGAFMDATNNIPLPSRGYALTVDFRSRMGRPPEGEEYRALRDLLDGRPDPELGAVESFLAAEGGPEAWRERMSSLFHQMIDEVVRINRSAGERDLNVIVFPEGTRSTRLGRGHTGLAQMTQHLGATIVPVGCNGSDKIYPGDLPFSKGGRVVYRIGEPLTVDGEALGPHRVSEPFRPLTDDATRAHGQRFEAITRVVMDRINGLLDPEHQYGEGDAVQGSRRFV